MGFANTAMRLHMGGFTNAIRMASRYPSRVRFLAYTVDGLVGFTRAGSAYTILDIGAGFSLCLPSVVVLPVGGIFICFFGTSSDEHLLEVEHGLL